MNGRFILIQILLLCVAGSAAAQSFSSLKKTATTTYNVTLNELLSQNDVQGMIDFLRINPASVNDASAMEEKGGLSKKKIQTPVPLLYDAIQRTLAENRTAEMSKVIINAGCNLNVPFNGKTPVYIVLDFIATHKKQECETAEQLLSLIFSRNDFDINFRYQSLLPPFAYLIRQNNSYLGGFSPDYISDNVLKMFIEKGAPVNTYDNEGNSLMNFAMETNNAFLQNYFIDIGINVQHENKEGKDALSLAIDNGNLPLVKRIIEENKTVLNEHNLKNKPSSFEKYPELYQYIAQHCANQAIKYTDIFDLQKFADKFSKLNTISEIFSRQKDLITATKNIGLLQDFADKYPNAVNAGAIYARQIALIEKEKENAMAQIYSKQYSGTANVSMQQMEKFIAYYTNNDPNNKINTVNYTLDLLRVIYGMQSVKEAAKTYWLYSTSATAPGLFEALFNADDWKQYHVRSASPYVNSAEVAHKALDRIMAKNDAPVFAETKNTLEQLYNEFVEKYNEAVERANTYNAELQERYARHKNQANEHQQERQEKCDKCVIDRAKTVFPTSGKFGKIYMKNGEEYNFDMTSKGRYQLVKDFYEIWKTEYDSFDKLASEFEEKCMKQYCD